MTEKVHTIAHYRKTKQAEHLAFQLADAAAIFGLKLSRCISLRLQLLHRHLTQYTDSQFVAIVKYSTSREDLTFFRKYNNALT